MIFHCALSSRCVIIHVHVRSYLSSTLHSDRTYYSLSRLFICPCIDDWRLTRYWDYRRLRFFSSSVQIHAWYTCHTITYAHLLSMIQPLWQFSPTVEHDAVRNICRFHISRKKMSYGRIWHMCA